MSLTIYENLYPRLSKLPVKKVTTDANYYDWQKDIQLYVAPAYAAFIEWAKQRVEGEVADLGCGDGNVGKALGARYFYDYIAGFEGVEVLDITKPIPEGVLKGDTFVLSHVLEHLLYPEDALVHLWAAMKEGDRLLIAVPNAGEVNNTCLPFNQYIPANDGKAKHIHHIHAFTSAELYNMLIQQGWDGIDLGVANVFGFSFIAALAIKS